MPTIPALPTNTVPAPDDIVPTVDVSANTTKKATLVSIIALLYPVGTIYTNANVSTNPATLLGFGTWVAFGAGRVPVGISSTDTDFDTAEETGGEKAHSLSGSENGTHAHGVYDPGHSHSTANGQQVAIQAASTNKLSSTGNAAQITWGNTGTSNNGSNIGIYNSGDGAPHNNLQPYIVVYMWKRTA